MWRQRPTRTCPLSPSHLQKAVQAAVGAPGAAKAPGAAAAAGEEEDEEDEEEEVEFREDMSEAEYEEAMRRAEARRGAQGNIAGARHAGRPGGVSACCASGLGGCGALIPCMRMHVYPIMAPTSPPLRGSFACAGTSGCKEMESLEQRAPTRTSPTHPPTHTLSSFLLLLHTSTGTSGSKKVESLEQRDEEAIAATRARLEAAATAAAANGVTADDGGDDGPAAAGARAASQGLSKSGIPLGLLPDQMTTVVLDRGEKWDCESVLSLRSNLSNHPGRIVEPQKRSGTRGGGTIVLSSKTGAPILQPTGVVPLSGRALAAAAKEAAKADAIAEEDGEGQDEDEDEKSEGAGEGSGSGSEEGGVLLLERRKGETAEEKKARKAAVKVGRVNSVKACGQTMQALCCIFKAAGFIARSRWLQPSHHTPCLSACMLSSLYVHAQPSVLKHVCSCLITAGGAAAGKDYKEGT